MPSHRKPHSAIPTVQNYDRRKKTAKVEQVEQKGEGNENRSPIPLPDKKAIEVSKGRTAGEPAKNDQKLNKKRRGVESEEEKPTQDWTTPDPKGGNL